MAVSMSDSTIQTSKIDTIRGEYKVQSLLSSRPLAFQPLGPVQPFQGPHIFVIRNGESIAEVFPDWIPRCELDVAFYVPFDLVLPVLPFQSIFLASEHADLDPPPEQDEGSLCPGPSSE